MKRVTYYATLQIELTETIAPCRVIEGGGKSGLHRAECQVTPGRCEPTESATENKLPSNSFIWKR